MRKGRATNISLPIAVTLATDLPAKLTLNPQLPELRGTSKSSFEFQLSIKNDSPQENRGQPVGDRAAELRRHLHRAIRQPGAQCAAARCRPVEGRQAQGPAAEHGRGRQIQGRPRRSRPTMRRSRPSSCIDITGQPKIDIAGREGVLSAKASAGRETSIPVILTNSGTAPAEQIELSGSVPPGWKIELRAQGRRSHRPEREQGGAGPGHADRQGRRRRLRHHRARRGARRIGVADVPRRGHDLHACGASSASPSSVGRCWS